MAELSLVACGASANLVYSMVEKLLTRRSAQIYRGLNASSEIYVWINSLSSTGRRIFRRDLQA